MNKIIGFMFLSAMIYMVIPALTSEAGMRCTTDFFGKTRCTDYESGLDVTQDQDFFGDDVYRDNNTGQTWKCRTDFFGDYVCD